MIPVSPDITIRSLTQADANALAHLLNQATARIQYCAPYDSDAVISEILVDWESEKSGTELRFSRELIGAWKAGTLIGFIDADICESPSGNGYPNQAAVGTLPQQATSHQRHYGVLRNLILPDSSELADIATRLLLNQLESRWFEGGIESIRAFLPATGYRRIQAGVGILPVGWREHFRLLTTLGYQLEQRYRAMTRLLDTFVEEIFPTSSISLETRTTPHGWQTQLYYRRVNQVGFIRLVEASLFPQPLGITDNTQQHNAIRSPNKIILVDELQIDNEWRGQNLGKLLLRRAINDGQHRGHQQMLMYLRQDQHVGWSLLAQNGFDELDYRGYSFQKHLSKSV